MDVGLGGRASMIGGVPACHTEIGRGDGGGTGARVAWRPTGKGRAGGVGAEHPERDPDRGGLTDPGDGLRRAVASGEDLASAVRGHARPGAGVREMVSTLVRMDTLVAGVGPELAPMVADPEVTDVLVNSMETWCDRGEGLVRVRADLGGEAQVRALAVHMAAVCGRRLDDACPIVDGTLPGGVRLHAILPPLSGAGTLISLRTSRPSALSMDHLVASGTVPPVVEPLVRMLVERRANTMISGATGSGKTTVLATLLGLVPRDQRIVCIEEVSELRPDHPHVIHLQERRPNVQGAGAVTLADLVRAAMRMRPDRLVLGECRGAEVRDVLTALNTGHEGGWATIHANDVQDVPARLAALGALAGMGDSAVAAQSAAAIDAVLQMRRFARAPGSGAPGEGAAELGIREVAGVRAARAGRAHSVRGSARCLCQIGVLVRVGDRLACQLAVDLSPGRGTRLEEGWPVLARRLGLDPDAGLPGGSGERVP